MITLLHLRLHAVAATAKGRTRWSKAILTSRLKLKFRKQKRQRGSVVAAVSGSFWSKKSRFSVSKLKAKSVSAVKRKVKVLGRLVPGCRKQPLPVILEEAADYIAALEMQIRAISTLAELLSSSGAASSTSAPPPQSPPTNTSRIVSEVLSSADKGYYDLIETLCSTGGGQE